MSSLGPSGPDEVDALLWSGDPGDTLDERRSLAAVERILFGRASNPATLGRYVLERWLGSGSVGVVYAAYDPELDRRVAVKTIAVDPNRVGAEAARSLLLHEAQAMARVSHPCVVEVYDVGTRTEGAYVVMDLVVGTDARRWLDSATRPLDDILRVFVDAGRGLAAAHAAGIVHRDFKPANVLLELASDGGVTRAAVSDFGLVWLIRDAGDARSPADLSRTVGTPRYMAPEQHRGRAPDVLADQYALCVALWEACAGRPPFSEQGLDELAAAKQAGLATTDRPATLPRWLFRVLRRGLDPDPRRRFATMDALVDALRNRGRRIPWGVAGPLALVLGAVATAVVAADAPAAPLCSGSANEMAAVYDAPGRDAITAAVVAAGSPHGADTATWLTQRLDAHAEAWIAARDEACAAPTPRGELPPEALGSRIACLDRSLTEIESVVDVLRRADADVVTRARELVGGMTPISRCADLDLDLAEGRRLRSEDPAEAAALATLEAELVAAEVTFRLGAYAQTREAALRLADAADARGYDAVAARALLLATRAASNEADPAAAEELGVRGWEAAIAAGDSHTAAAAAIALVGLVGSRQSRYEDAQAWVEHARAQLQRIGNPPLLEAALLTARGRIDAQTDRPGALDLLRQAARLVQSQSDVDPRRVAASEWDLGWALTLGGAYPEALEHHRRALTILARELGEDHPKVGQAHTNVGAALTLVGRHRDALVHLTPAREMARRFSGEQSQAFIDVESILAGIEERQGHRDRGLARRQRLIALAPGVRGPDHPIVADLLSRAAIDLAELGRTDEALAAIESAHVRSERLPRDHRIVGDLDLAQAQVLLRAGRIDEARSRAEEGTRILVGRFGPEHAALHRSRLLLAEIALGEDELADATARLEAVLADPAADPVDRADAEALLARVLWDTDPLRARQLASRAMNAFREQGAAPKSDALLEWAESSSGSARAH